MELLGWIILFTALGAMLGVLAASTVLLLPQTVISRLLPALVSFAIGALLGAAFLGLLPNALEGADTDEVHRITAVVLGGVLVFFLLEKMVLWRHCHVTHCEAHTTDFEQAQKATTATIILVGDGIHNLVDGVLIGAAFLTDFHLGIVTSFAVIAHELPQELGDVAILLHGGFGKAKTLFYNLLSSLSTIVGGVAAYFSLAASLWVVPYVLAVAAASFIYIAMADLIPGLHKQTDTRAIGEQMLLILTGVAVIFLAHSTLH